MNKHFFSILNRLSFVKRDQNRLIIIRAYFIEKLLGMFLVVRLTCYSLIVCFLIACSLAGLSHPTLTSTSADIVFMRAQQLGVWPTMVDIHLCVDLCSKNDSSDVGG